MYLVSSVIGKSEKKKKQNNFRTVKIYLFFLDWDISQEGIKIIEGGVRMDFLTTLKKQQLL